MLALLAIASLAVQCAFALPKFGKAAFTASNLEVSHLHALKTAGTGNTSQVVFFNFRVHDPDPLTNSSTDCGTSWAVGSGYPSGGYAPCSNSSFSFNFADDGFQNVDSFMLQIKHSYEDDAMGPYPYNSVTNFAHANVTSADLTCTTVKNGSRKGQEDCSQRRAETIKAPIWASM